MLGVETGLSPPHSTADFEGYGHSRVIARLFEPSLPPPFPSEVTDMW